MKGDSEIIRVSTKKLAIVIASEIGGIIQRYTVTEAV